uniref:(northern house mosquito) hypothetical protein n=2 Tax=Culex pipiens TaxID=7175 RepID=A0A8D8CSN3_CULPI
MASRGHQIPPERAVPGRAGVREPADESAGPGPVGARCRQGRHEVVPVRHARVQVRHQRQDRDGGQGPQRHLRQRRQRSVPVGQTGGGDRRLPVPPVRQAEQVRDGTLDQLHSAGR